MRLLFTYLFSMLYLFSYSQNKFKVGYMASAGAGGIMEKMEIQADVYANTENLKLGSSYSTGLAFFFKSKTETNFEIDLLYNQQTIKKIGEGWTDTGDKFLFNHKLKLNRVIMPIKWNHHFALFKKKAAFSKGISMAFNFFSSYVIANQMSNYFNTNTSSERVNYIDGEGTVFLDKKVELSGHVGFDFVPNNRWQIGVECFVPFSKNKFVYGQSAWQEVGFYNVTGGLRVVYWVN